MKKMLLAIALCSSSLLNTAHNQIDPTDIRSQIKTVQKTLQLLSYCKRMTPYLEYCKKHHECNIGLFNIDNCKIPYSIKTTIRNQRDTRLYAIHLLMHIETLHNQCCDIYEANSNLSKQHQRRLEYVTNRTTKYLDYLEEVYDSVTTQES